MLSRVNELSSGASLLFEDLVVSSQLLYASDMRTLQNGDLDTPSEYCSQSGSCVRILRHCKILQHVIPSLFPYIPS